MIRVIDSAGILAARIGQTQTGCRHWWHPIRTSQPITFICSGPLLFASLADTVREAHGPHLGTGQRPRFLQLLQLLAHFHDFLQLIQVAARELIHADMLGVHHPCTSLLSSDSTTSPSIAATRFARRGRRTSATSMETSERGRETLAILFQKAHRKAPTVENLKLSRRPACCKALMTSVEAHRNHRCTLSPESTKIVRHHC